jgi:hypothetical protein
MNLYWVYTTHLAHLEETPLTQAAFWNTDVIPLHYCLHTKKRGCSKMHIFLNSCFHPVTVIFMSAQLWLLCGIPLGCLMYKDSTPMTTLFINSNLVYTFQEAERTKWSWYWNWFYRPMWSPFIWSAGWVYCLGLVGINWPVIGRNKLTCD